MWIKKIHFQEQDFHLKNVILENHMETTLLKVHLE